MSKHTHRATCQACGAVQAASNGSNYLAKHGYTVDWGFNGTCDGSDSLPIELSTTIADQTIARLTGTADLIDTYTVADMDTVTVEIKRSSSYERNPNEGFFTFKSQLELDAWKQINSSAWRVRNNFAELQARKLATLQHRAKSMRAHVASLKELIETRFGQDLYPVDAGPERVRETFAKYPEAYERAETLKADGFKTRVTRDKYSNEVILTGTRAAA